MGTIRKEKAKIKALPAAADRVVDVVALGENSVDLVAMTPDWPAPDTKLPLDRLEVLPGGQIATAAIACARLGVRTRYAGVVGEDAWADLVRSALARDGVDAALFVRRRARTRSAVVLVDRKGRRSILEDRDPRLAFADGELDESWLASGRILMIDATDPAAALAAAAVGRRAGMAVMVDIDQAAPTAHSLLAVADVVITSAGFPAAFTGCASVGAALEAMGRRYPAAILIATLGSEGAIARAEGIELSVPAPPVDVVDTTGAGDAFRGAFAAGWARLGDRAELGVLLRRAVVAGALNCRAAGAQTALPSPAELEKWL